MKRLNSLYGRQTEQPPIVTDDGLPTPTTGLQTPTAKPTVTKPMPNMLEHVGGSAQQTENTGQPTPKKPTGVGMDVARGWLSQFMNTPQSANSPQYVKTDDPDNGMLKYLTLLYGDPEQTAKRERADRQRMGILALGDAIRQMGNIYHTTKYAPSQTLNNQAAEEYERIKTQEALNQKQRQAIAELNLKLQAQQDLANYRNANLALKNDQNETQKMLAGSKVKTEEAKRGYIDKQGQYIDKKTADIEEAAKDRRANTQARIAHMKEQERQGWARVGIQRGQLEVARQRAANTAKNGGGLTGKGKGFDLVTDSNGIVMKVPTSAKNKENARALYDGLVKRGKVKPGAGSEEEMWSAIMNNGNDASVQRFMKNVGAEMVDDVGAEAGAASQTSDGRWGLLDAARRVASGIADRASEYEDLYDDLEEDDLILLDDDEIDWID